MTYQLTTPIITEISIDKTTYSQIIMTGCSSYGQPGSPQLPVLSVVLTIPYGKTVGEVTVTPGNKKEMTIDAQIIPVVESVPLTDTNTTSSPTPDPQIYSSDAPYPQNLLVTKNIQYFRGITLLYCTLSTCQYTPLSGILTSYDDLTVTISTPPTSNTHSLYRGLITDVEKASGKIQNPTSLETYPCSDSSDSIVRSYDLLIITNDTLKEGFQPLIKAHSANGIRTILKTMGNDIPLGSSYNQTCINIRNYIKRAYTTWNIEFVLIGGDIEFVPAPYLLGDIPSDIFYSCLDGPYNSDGDEKWGESTDGEGGGDVDLVAEIYIGRACAGNLTEVGYFVNKTLAYLKRNTSDRYLNNVIMAGERYNEDTWGDDYVDQLINGSSANGYTTVGVPADEYTIQKLYDRDWPGHSWPVTEIINRINNGTYLINHAGHAGYFYNMKLNVREGHIDLLTNEKHCFIYSQGCDAGAFDRNSSNNPEHFIPDCIAEHLTVKTPYGAFAGIWNTRSGYFHSGGTNGPSQRYHREFWDAVFAENLSVLSVANQDSKEDTIFIVDNSNYRDLFFELSLFGDPTLDIVNRPLHASTHGPYEAAVNSVLQFRGSANGGSAPYTWLWDFGDGNISKLKNPRHRYRSDGVYTVSLTVTDSNGDSVVDQTTAFIHILVDAHGPYDGLIDEPICFTGSAVGGYLPYHWNWDFGDGNTSQKQNPIHTYSRVGQYTVTLHVTDSRYNTGNDTVQAVILSAFVYVDDNAPAGGDGSYAYPYQHITDGVEAVAEEGTVYVYNGTYNESLLINKTLSLFGEEKNTTILTGDNCNPTIYLTADDVTIQGFTIQSRGLQGLTVSQCNRTTIVDNIFVGTNSCPGIELQVSSHDIIKKNSISNYYTGISVSSYSHNNTISENVIHNNSYSSIALDSSYYNTISGNTIRDTPEGITLSSFRTPMESAHHNLIQENCILNCIWSSISLRGAYRYPCENNSLIDNVCSTEMDTILLEYAQDTLLMNNTCSSTRSHTILLRNSLRTSVYSNTMYYGGLFLQGEQDAFTTQTIPINNTVDGKPVYYFANCMMNNESVPQDAGEVVLGNVSWLLIENNQFSVGSVGVLLGYSSHVTILNTTTAQSAYGFSLWYSHNITLMGNTITKADIGIDIQHSRSNVVTQNTITDSYYGMFLETSTHNTLVENTIVDGEEGIDVSAMCTENTIAENTIMNNALCGISLYGAPQNTIRNNILVNNTYIGIGLYFSFFSYSSSDENTIVGNTVMNSETGITIKDSMYNTVQENWIEQNGCGVNISVMFLSSDNNLLYHNNFVGNVLSAYDSCSNIWNASVPDGGNYWSDYQGVDEDGDGIGDTPYVIRGGNNADDRPFIQPNGWRKP